MEDSSLTKRFASKWQLNKDSGCWEWTASLAGKGYGQIKLTGQRKQEYAHRVSYLIHVGEIPEGKSVLHKCDNPKCVNPQHLFIGTAQDNMTDMVNKGRSTLGEKNPQSVLKEADVRAIRMLADKGELSQQQIADMFGIGQMEVSRIKRRLRWAFLK